MIKQENAKKTIFRLIFLAALSVFVVFVFRDSAFSVFGVFRGCACAFFSLSHHFLTPALTLLWDCHFSGHIYFFY